MNGTTTINVGGAAITLNTATNDFTGAVGQFDLDTKIDRNDVEVNDGITLTILLSGTGNIGLFSFPEPKFPDDIEVFPPAENFEKDELNPYFSNTHTGTSVC